jgi:hypothetical protein
MAWPTTAASPQITMEIHISSWTHKFQNRTGLDAKTNSELYKSNRVCSVEVSGRGSMDCSVMEVTKGTPYHLAKQGRLSHELLSTICNCNCQLWAIQHLYSTTHHHSNHEGQACSVLQCRPKKGRGAIYLSTGSNTSLVFLRRGVDIEE